MLTLIIYNMTINFFHMHDQREVMNCSFFVVNLSFSFSLIQDEDEYLNRRREEIESRAKVKKDELVDQKVIYKK